MARLARRRGRVPFDRSRKTGVLRFVIVAALIAAFLITPFFLTRSIIFVEPSQGALLLGVFALTILLALPLSRKSVNTKILVWALVFYVGFDVMWADYVAVKIPLLPLMTPVRLLILALDGIWLFLAATTRGINDRIWQMVKAQPVLAGSLATLFVFQILAIPLSIDTASSISNMFNYVTFYYIPFLIAGTVFRTRGQIESLLKTLVICAGLVGVIVVFESILRQNLYVAAFGRWINWDAEWLRPIFAGIERFGKYRALGPFVNYLSLGDYCVLTIPFSIYFFEKSKTPFVRLLLAVVILLSAYGTIAADSRTAMLALLVVAAIYGIVKAQRFLVHNSRSTLRPLIALVLIGGILVGPMVIYVAYKRVGGDDTFGDGYGSRKTMFVLGAHKVAHRPIIGYGPAQAGVALGWRSDGVHLTIDSYYLSMALDAGLPGLIAFTMLPATLIFVAYRRSRRKTEDDQLFFAFAMSGLGFALVRITTSQYENVNFFHVLLGAFVALLLLIKEESASVEETAQQSTRRSRRGRLRVGEKGLLARSPL